MKKFTRSIFKTCLAISLLLLGLGQSTYSQTVIYNENFDNATGSPGALPTGWTTSVYNQITPANSNAYGPWGRAFSSSCYNQTYNGLLYYYFYPQGYQSPYYYHYYYTNSHNGSSCSTGMMYFPSYYNSTGSSAEAATPPLNFNSSYSATNTGGFLVSFWVYLYNLSSNAKIDVFVNNVASSTGAVQLGSDIFPYATTGYSGTWVNYTYSLPASFNSSTSVYIIFRGQTGTTSYTYDPMVDDVSVTYVPPCNGAPTAPTITSSPIATAVCPGTSAVISASDPNITPGISFIWQSAPTAAGPWTNVAAGNGNGTLNYTVPGVTDTTYFRVEDSCQLSHTVVASTNTYKVPVVKYTLPYLETFNAITALSLPACYNVNDNNGVSWAVNNVYSANGTPLTAIRASDPATNAAYGKNNFFTLPGFTLTGSQVYAVRFKYARGRQNALTNTGNTYSEHLQVYANATSPGYSVSNVTGGTLLFDQNITFDNVADTTLYFAPPANGSYYFSWYTNTPHPAGTPAIAGGHLIVDSIYVGSATCVAPAFTLVPATVNGCLGSPAALTVTASGTANSFQWYKGGTLLTSASSKTASYSVASAAYTDSGMYTVVATNPCGNVTSSNIQLTVSAPPSTTLFPSGSTTFCAGSPFSITAASGSGYMYVWKTNGTANGSTTSNYQPTTSGSYSVTITGATGCTATSASIPVTVNAVPVATVTPSGPTSFCNGDSVNLIATTGANLSYQWYRNNIGINPGGTSVTYLAKPPFAAGTYKVVVSNANCSATSANTVVISTAPPTATITSSGGTSICSGSALTLTATAGTGYTYQWLLNNGNINNTTATYSAVNSGSYSVTVTSAGCSATSAPVTVNVIPSPPAIITASSTAICTGGYVVLNADTAATATTYTYQWFKGGVSTGVTNYSDTVSVAGNYTVTIGNSNNCYTTSPITAVSINALPTAVVTVTGSNTVCAGNNVLLIANGGPGYTYQWQGNSAGVIPGATGQYYNASATDSYKVIVTDLNNCQNITTTGTAVTINALPTINIVTGGPTSFCPGNSVTLFASPGAGSGLTYLWYLNGATTGVTAALYTATTSGTVTVRATNASLCSALSTPVSTTLNAAPAATIQANGSTSFCAGGSVTLCTTPGAGYTYLWKNKAGTVLSIFPCYTAATTDSIDVKVTSSISGCSGISSFTSGPGTTPYIGVTLNPSPGATAAAIGGTTICSGNSVTLAADTNSSAGITYQWKLNNGVLGGAVAPSYTASTGGSYTVSTSNGNCTTTSTPILVTVNPTPASTITPLSNPIICSNQFVTLSATTSTGSTYQWRRNGNMVSATGSTSANFTTDTAGAYTLVTTSSLGCAGTSTPVTVTVNATPTINVAAITPTTICQGDTAKLYASSNTGNLAYKWSNGATLIPNVITNSLNVTTAGVFSLTVIAINGCSNTATPVTIAVNPAPNPIVIQNKTVLSAGSYSSYKWYLNGKAITGATGSTLTISQTGRYSVFVTDYSSCAAMSPVLDVTSLATTGVGNVANNVDIKLYPNPTTSIVHIEASIPVNVSISSLDGKLLIQGKHVTQLDLSPLANGIYMISLYDDNNMLIKIEKLVKSSW
jgi:hypothetical protein